MVVSFSGLYPLSYTTSWFGGCIQFVWNVFVLGIAFGVYCYAFAAYLIYRIGYDFTDGFLYSSMLLQGVSLAFSTYCNSKRISSDVSEFELPLYPKSLTKSNLVLCYLYFHSFLISLEIFTFPTVTGQYFLSCSRLDYLLSVYYYQ
jgi:hypothetical protein